MKETKEDRGERVPENDPLKRGNHNREGLSNNSEPKFDDIEMKKTEHNSGSTKKHEETQLAGLCNTCTFCNKEFKSKASLTKHKYKMH